MMSKRQDFDLFRFRYYCLYQLSGLSAGSQGIIYFFFALIQLHKIKICLQWCFDWVDSSGKCGTPGAAS